MVAAIHRRKGKKWPMGASGAIEPHRMQALQPQHPDTHCRLLLLSSERHAATYFFNFVRQK